MPVPNSAYATLGVHKDIIWLRIPVALPADSDGEWILNIDYAVLNRMDIYVATDGQIREHQVIGNLQPDMRRATRPRASRPAAPHAGQRTRTAAGAQRRRDDPADRFHARPASMARRSTNRCCKAC
jgi:hypothetical protein